ncbi:radical S-adenosyl methionine domain-containing protein 1, mitochondrial isoform X3 [Camarhynchus parvulus]|uniref:radical S-adenosyl methionine domain-containing protein 1, mitochondrial isoform X3 n=1 Tax=Geospiza parvula TaxID=87175 RepID=UPI001237AF76|nr:radical S-adenosyl methionine domain-containing protein 1, mitochondrial isoform X3 [Camarhynchus parvulus]
MAAARGWLRKVAAVAGALPGGGGPGRAPGPAPDTAAPATAALYVHWPYCRKRCSYCNFNTYVVPAVDEAAVRACLVREAQTLLRLSQVHSVTSVFFGGGTPSLASPGTVAAVLEAVAGAAHLPAGAEVTLEANPSSTSASALDGFRAAGVNRLSIGVQSRDAWAQRLEATLRLCDDHISLYQLTLERGTALAAQVRGGALPAPPQDLLADMYQTARNVLVAAGFRHYEVSNFARKVGCPPCCVPQCHVGPPSRLSHSSHPRALPQGALSTHNLSYWRAEQYIGVGPGAHGRFVLRAEGGCSREARVQTLEPVAWMREVQSQGHGTRSRAVLSPLEQLEELLTLGLRMDEGITHERWGHFSPQLSLQAVFGEPGEARALQQEGWLVLDSGGLRCTWAGLAVLDSLLPDLLWQLQRVLGAARRPPRGAAGERAGGGARGL